MLNEWKYDVSLGGIDFDVSIVKKGIQVSMSGYVEHIPKLMSHLGKKLTEIEIPESRFVTIKENLKQDIQNTFTSHAYSQTIYEIKNLVTPNFIHRKDLYFATQNGEVKVNLVDDITLDEVKQHAKDLYDQLEIEGCSYGPLDVKVLKERIEIDLKESSRTSTLEC